MCRQVSAMVRFWAERIQCLILAKAYSMGVTSEEPCTGGADELAQRRRFVAAEIVNDDDIAWV